MSKHALLTLLTSVPPVSPAFPTQQLELKFIRGWDLVGGAITI